MAEPQLWGASTLFFLLPVKLTPGCSRPTGAAHALKLDMQALQNLQGSPGGVKKAQESVAAAI
eukprot:scaffold256725_cov12-Tisochrysis_lutea.AAC.2